MLFRSCWFAWHRGPNNAQTTRIQISCSACGSSFEKNPARIGGVNYCSRKCASAAHRAKISGNKHPNWRGGSVASKGSSWRLIRQNVLDRQGGKCADCGMSNESHKAKYRSGLHVHHRTPYRLSLDNSPENLVAVCIPCHGKEESKTNKALRAKDFETMRERSDRDRALGFHSDDDGRQYDQCPTCNGRKAKQATLCRSCRAAEKFKASKHLRCPKCGGRKGPESKQCWNCRITSGHYK